MHFLYNIGILSYGLLISIFSLFNSKAKKWKDGRKDFFNNIPSFENVKLFWFHCASLGEFDQALPVINKIKTDNPEIFILVTFFSPSGYEHYNKRKHHADYVCYLPLDTPKNAKKFIHHFKPDKVFFVKYEFWANYIFEAKKSGAKLFSISSIFRPNQRFFSSYFFSKILLQFDYFFVQNYESKELLKSIDINNIEITGDTRFDRVIENKNNLEKNIIIDQFKNNQPLWVIGSSWPVDETILYENINSINSKIIIAPHDISDKHITLIINNLKCSFIKYSEIKTSKDLSEIKVLILDTIGHLANAYYYGDFAYVGGGFTGSLHNILEPAVFGLPIIFGPKHKKFPEAELFLKNDVAFEVENSEDISIIINKFLNEDLSKFKNKIQEIVALNKGASEKIVQQIANLI
jgi:3-deoxy-D-manno-octulosonic-acid transferase